MPKEPTGSAVPRRQVGRRLQELREGACLTRRTVANALYISESTLWRMEKGLNVTRPSEAEEMCKLYGTPTEVVGPLVALAAQAMRKGWWFRYSDVIPAWYDLYVGLENEASRQLHYEPKLVPSLLQTADYARDVIARHNPKWDRERVQRHVEFRMSRQALLTRPIAMVEMAIAVDECVLRRGIGDAEVMDTQLRHLRELSEWPNISLRVVPLDAGYHQGLRSGAFVILDFPDTAAGKPSEPPVVYLEGLSGAAYLDDAGDIAAHRRAFANISGLALDEQDSRSLLDRIRADLAVRRTACG